MLRQIPTDAPPWLLDHLAAERALAAGLATVDDLIPVIPRPEGSEQYDHLFSAPGFRTVWYRLPRHGPTRQKRHSRQPVPGDDCWLR